MTWRRALPWLATFTLLAAAGGWAALGSGGGDSRPPTEGAVIERVVDGDTVKVRLGHGEDTVRYIGVDTPETKKPGEPVECFGKAASAENEGLVEGRRVELRFDAQRRDSYGRLLAYVHRLPDGLFVNAELVRRGLARPLAIPPNVAHADLFGRLQREARRSGRGLWEAC